MDRIVDCQRDGTGSESNRSVSAISVCAAQSLSDTELLHRLGRSGGRDIIHLNLASQTRSMDSKAKA